MFCWICGFVVGVAIAVAAVGNNQVPKTGFSCKGRTTGYYADVESGCQVYHMCDGLGRQFSYTCPNATLFQQRMLICDHWYMVNCSRSVDDYTANLRIGHKEMPFVDDSESNPYYRTPRPDLRSHPSQSEYDIIYRTGRAQLGTNLNLVGAGSNKNSTTSRTTEEPTYSLPSHWSTEYNKQITTSKPKSGSTSKKGLDGTTVKGKPITVVNNTKNEETARGKTTPTTSQSSSSSSSTHVPNILVPINFKSDFKATTPVYPKSVDIVSEEPSDVGVLPPGSELIHLNSTNVRNVNFESNFIATTPVYPKIVDITSEEPAEVGVLPPSGGTNDSNDIPDVKVNYKSEFKATTPVYPKIVDITSEEPSDVGVVPPEGQSAANSTVDVKVNFQSDFKATTPVYPKTVDVVSEEPAEVGVLPPATGTNSTNNVPSLSLEFLPPEVDVDFNPADRPQEVVLPSKFYQPPKFEPDFTELQTNNRESKTRDFKALSNDEWENLRRKFFIPDYEFPLESVSRPSYDSILSSFQSSGMSSREK